MNEEDKLLLFMPIVSASLTNAVYTCQLLNPDMKHDPEAAIRHVLLTSQRMNEVMNKLFVQDQNNKVSLAQFLLSEIASLEQKSKEIVALSPDRKSSELRFLNSHKSLLEKIMDVLISGQP